MRETLKDLPSKMIDGQPWVPLFPVQAIVADLLATAELVERAEKGMERHGSLLWYDKPGHQWVTTRVQDGGKVRTVAGTPHREWIEALKALGEAS